MAATLTTLNAALDRIWTQRTLESQLYDATPFLSKVEKRSNYTIGELARVPLKVSWNGAYTALPDGGGSLNTAGNVGIAKAEYTYKHHHVPIAIQGDALDQTSSNTLSVANGVDTEVSGALEILRRNLQRQLFMDGTALITACVSSSSNSVDVALVTGLQAIRRGWIHVGQQVDVGTTTVEDDIVNGSTITAIDSDDLGFTVAAGNISTEDANDFVSQKDARDGTTSYEMNGLNNLIDNAADFGGLTVAAQPEWKSYEDSTSQPLTLALLDILDQEIHQQTGSKSDFLLLGLKQNRKFYELLQQQVRFTSDAAIGAGDQTPKWNGRDIFVDPDAFDEFAYAGQLKHLFMVAIDRPYWQDKVTGGNKLVWSQGTDSYVGKITHRCNLATDRRNGFAKLSGLS